MMMMMMMIMIMMMMILMMMIMMMMIMMMMMMTYMDYNEQNDDLHTAAIHKRSGQEVAVRAVYSRWHGSRFGRWSSTVFFPIKLVKLNRKRSAKNWPIIY